MFSESVTLIERTCRQVPASHFLKAASSAYRDEACAFSVAKCTFTFARSFRGLFCLPTPRLQVQNDPNLDQHYLAAPHIDRADSLPRDDRKISFVCYYNTECCLQDRGAVIKARLLCYGYCSFSTTLAARGLSPGSANHTIYREVYSLIQHLLLSE